MITLYLSFPDVNSALAMFSAITGEDVSAIASVPSKVSVNGVLCDVDIVGNIVRDTTEIDENGLSISEPVAGWHVNVWVPDDAIIPSELDAFRVYPSTPSRSFG